jgi:hypothetical protein
MINNNKILSLTDDTLLMAIDIFRKYVCKVDYLKQQKLACVCIACVVLASKINDIYPIAIN